MKIIIPGKGELEIITLILDLNGTLTVRGKLVDDSVVFKIKSLQEKGVEVVLFSGDTRGDGAKTAEILGIKLITTKNKEEKSLEARKFDLSKCATIGNGLIDTLLFKDVELSIGVIQGEGIHTTCLLESDIITTSIVDALDLLLDENSLIATLRS